MARRSRFQAAAVAATAALALGAGCHGKAAAPAGAPADAGPVATPLDQALAQAKEDHRHYLKVLAQGKTWKMEVTRRYPAVFAAAHLKTRLPMGYDAARIKAELDTDLAGGGLTLKTFHIKVDKALIPADRKIPDTLAPGEPFTWLTSEIGRKVELGAVVTPGSERRVKRWVNAQWRSGRLFAVTTVNLAGENATIDLTTWYLVRQVKVPVRRMKPFDADEALETAGVDLAANGQSPKAEAVRRLYREVNAKVPAINAAYQWEAKARLLAARYQFFEHALAECRKRSFKDVIK